jgi:hypothetical protein
MYNSVSENNPFILVNSSGIPVLKSKIPAKQGSETLSPFPEKY